MKTTPALALVSAIIVALGAIPAGAASTRTWVSGSGQDTGTCPVTSPCASFEYALSQTVTGGEIDCLNAGEFGGSGGTLTITQSVTIVCNGPSNGGLLTSSPTSSITVSAGAGAVVYLSGLDLNGLNGTAGSGVYVETGSTVYIVHCTIRSFSGPGVSIYGTTNPTRVFIQNSIIVNNSYGVFVQGEGGATNAAIIVNSILDGNSNSAAGASGANGTSLIAVEKTALTGSPTGLNLTDGATAELIGPSNIVGGAIVGTTTSVAFK
jgi:hypothetical protein